MNDEIRQALATDRVIDITTAGRKTGEPRRCEIWFHIVDDHVYITGTPGPRSWYANLLANPTFTFHLKESVQADLAATAVPVTESLERRRILDVLTRRLGATAPLQAWVDGSPLVEVLF